MDEVTLQSSIQTYSIQLKQVETALQAAGEHSNAGLVKLRDDLTELVQLTTESLLSLKKSHLLRQIDEDSLTSAVGDVGDVAASTSSGALPASSYMDDEFAAFQAAIADEENDAVPASRTPQCVDGAASSGESSRSADDGCEPDLDAIVASKCCVMYGQEWGERRAHNALILQLEPITAEEPPKVRVIFCNPTHRSMVPCSYFMDGDCRFGESECRFSHGHVVEVDELCEFVPPDYSELSMESKCLAKQADGIWRRAIVVELPHAAAATTDDDDDDMGGYKVMFEQSHHVRTVSLQDIIPQVVEGGGSDEESDAGSCEEDGGASGVIGSEDEDEDVLPVFLWRPSTAEVLGEWESHTRGIGSKLMAAMGYITGEGLGSRSQGRAEPVPIQLLPVGKSLDKIMELKERAGNQDLYDVMKKRKRKRKTQPANTQQPAKRKPKSVFDFINRKLGKTKVHHDSTRPNHQTSKKAVKVSEISEADLKQRSDKHINVQLFKTDEEMKNVKKEMTKLKMTLNRHDKTDRRMAAQTRQKLEKMERYQAQLETSHRAMQRQQQRRTDRKKLTIF